MRSWAKAGFGRSCSTTASALNPAVDTRTRRVSRSCGWFIVGSIDKPADCRCVSRLARLRGFAVRKRYFLRRAPDTSLIFHADILPQQLKTAVVKTYPIPMP